jgi:hypothetical protein
MLLVRYSIRTSRHDGLLCHARHAIHGMGAVVQQAVEVDGGGLEKLVGDFQDDAVTHTGKDCRMVFWLFETMTCRHSNKQQQQEQQYGK